MWLSICLSTSKLNSLSLVRGRQNGYHFFPTVAVISFTYCWPATSLHFYFKCCFCMYSFTRGHLCADVFTQAGGGGNRKWTSSAFLDCFSTVLFETGSPTEPCHFWQTRWPMSPWDLAVSAPPPPVLGLQVCLVTPGFYVDDRDLHSRLHTCTATSLPISLGAAFCCSWSMLSLPGGSLCYSLERVEERGLVITSVSVQMPLFLGRKQMSST